MNLFALTLQIELRCIQFPLIILEMSLQLDWSPPVANSIDWTRFRKKHTFLYKGPTVDSACQSRNSTMKSKELFVELRDRIVRRHRSGEGYEVISRVLKIPKSTVSSIMRKWKEYGTTQTLPRAGHPTKLSNQARRTLVREGNNNPMTSLTELQSSLAEMGELARRTTVSAALHKSRLHGRVARQKLLLRKTYITA